MKMATEISLEDQVKELRGEVERLDRLVAPLVRQSEANEASIMRAIDALDSLD